MITNKIVIIEIYLGEEVSNRNGCISPRDFIDFNLFVMISIIFVMISILFVMITIPFVVAIRVSQVFFV